MAASQSLIGRGVPPEAAAVLGFTSSTKAGAGTAQTGATAINTNMTIVTATGGATAFVLPAAIAGSGPMVIYNSSGTSALIYPGSGKTFNGGSADAALTLPTLRSLVIFKTDATNWSAFFNATS